jgi:hypothetical protein
MRTSRPIPILTAIAATAFALLVASAPPPALANRCTGTCGDGSTFDKPAATCDACRVLVCPRTCRIDGVTSCLWCGNQTSERSQTTRIDVTVRSGPDPNNPNAPTGPVQGTGTSGLRPGTATDGPGGTIIVPIEMIQLDLQSVSPLYGPGQIQKQDSPPAPRSGGTFQNLIPGQDWPAESFFDVFVEVDLPALGVPLHNIQPIRCYNQSQPSDPIAMENIMVAPVRWDIVNGPVPLHDPGGMIRAWILNGWIEIEFANGDATDVPPPPGPAENAATSWGSVKTLYR